MKARAAAMVELRTEVRTVKGHQSDALRLAALLRQARSRWMPIEF
jgi:hypothetical protein